MVVDIVNEDIVNCKEVVEFNSAHFPATPKRVSLSFEIITFYKFIVIACVSTYKFFRTQKR